MIGYDSLGDWPYDELVAELDSLGDLILLYQDMTPEQETGWRKGSAQAGRILPGDFRAELTIEDGRKQVEIVRECLRRVSLEQLSQDTGFSEDALLGFATYTERPSAN